MEKSVPDIRFKEFSGEWVEKELNEAIEAIGTGKSNFVSNTARTEQNKFAILGSRGVIGYDSTYDYSGDFILTARVGENAGRLYKYSGDVKITDNTVFIKSEGLVFVFYLLDKFDLRRLAFGTGQPLIKASELNSLKLFSPFNKKEQTQIGNTFQKLDSLINQHQQKHDKLRSIKKAMLEKMFPKQGETTPEIRFKGFSGEWEEKELADVANMIMGQSPSGENYTDNPNDFILVQGNADLKNGFVVPRVWTSEATKVATKGALIFSVRAPVGEVGKTNYDVVLGRGVAAIYGNEFIYQQLRRLQSDNYWYKVSAGSTFDAISSAELASTFIWVSSESEQDKIGNYFQKLDTLINQHQQQITKLNNIKQACLSKMFV